MIDTPEARFAMAAARRAASVVRQVQAEMAATSLTKEDRSPVTVADFAAQAVVARQLLQTFPGQPLVAEENAAALREDAGQSVCQRVTEFVARVEPQASAEAVCQWIDLGCAEPTDSFWTLDPVDGTKGFLRGNHYAVALAKIEKGVVRIGVLACPHLNTRGETVAEGPGTLLVAARGQGSWCSPLDDGHQFQQLRVSSRSQPAEARLLRSVEAAHTNTGQIDRLVTRLGIQVSPVAIDSQAKYAVLAMGGGDLLVRFLSPSRPNYCEKIWDQAAGSLVIEEAGGRVTDLDGKRLDFNTGRTLDANRGVLATNGHLHQRVLAALAATIDR